MRPGVAGSWAGDPLPAPARERPGGPVGGAGSVPASLPGLVLFAPVLARLPARALRALPAEPSPKAQDHPMRLYGTRL
jgi:hypothetical protein